VKLRDSDGMDDDSEVCWMVMLDDDDGQWSIGEVEFEAVGERDYVVIRHRPRHG
jgi:hypothetical protein